jgi:outer membrane protein OmpA-like peptidoglycan-associated protein
MNLRSFITIIILTVSLSQIYAQKNKDEVKVKRSEFKTGVSAGLQEAWLAILDGDEYFNQGVGTYNMARDLYLSAYRYNAENPELNYLIGICYLYTDDKFEAVKYLRKAYEKKSGISPEINYLLGRAYHLILEFDKAIQHYSTHRTSLGPKEAVLQYDFIDKLISECRNGKAIVADRQRVIISNMGDSINSMYDDYFSIFADNGSVMYFTSRRPFSNKSKRNIYDNKFFEDVYFSELVNGGWSEAKRVNKKIDSKHNDAAVGISNDGTQLFVYRGEEKGGDIYVSAVKNGEWKSPVQWNSKFSSDESETSLFFTQTGDTVYFISANKDLTMGGRDIVMSVKNPKGKWIKPTNLSSLVNSKYDEEGIYLTPDGNTIYFSSRGHNTMGGFDVFKTEKQSDGIWSDPLNMGYPINTPDNELFFSLSANGKTAYISTIRDGGYGAKDIYKMVFLGSEKEMILSKEDILIAGTLEIVKKGFFTLPELISVDSFFYLKGRVLNKTSQEPVVAKLEFVDSEESKIMATVVSSETGEYQAKFMTPKKYDVEIVAKDYLFYLDAVDMTTASSDEPFVMDFFLDKVEVGTKVVLENINFETSKATLTAASFPKLDQIITFLKNNESIRVEISGHTDNVGSAKINLELSENRAKSVVLYMVSHGISKSRLESKGYGFSQPIAPNDTPEGREQNRRVEFKVISK